MFPRLREALHLFAGAAVLLSAPAMGQVQRQEVVLARLASVRLAAVPAGVPQYLVSPTVASSGRVFALRMPARKLVSLDVRGTSLVLREIALPRSILAPIRITSDEAGRLLVLDALSHRVSRFTTDGGVLRAAGSFQAGTSSRDLCSMNGQVYVYEPREARPVAVYSATGRVVGRFGRQFGSGSEERREMMSGGQMHCAVAERRLFVASRITGEIQAYLASGRAIWSRRVPGVIALPVLESGQGVTMVSPATGYHTLIGFTMGRRGWLLAQYGFQEADQLSGYRAVQSYWIAAERGVVDARQDDLPGWTTALGGDRVLSLDQTSGVSTLWRVSTRRR